MKIVGTIEARIGSSRLPEKILMKVYKDFTLLELVVKRFKLCGNIDDIIVATTVEKQDDKIAFWCEQNGVSYYRGSEENVLDRVRNASIKASADIIVQMGADSAYLDFKLIDELIEIYFNKKEWRNLNINKKLHVLYKELGRDVLNLDYNEAEKMTLNSIKESYTYDEFAAYRESMFIRYFDILRMNEESETRRSRIIEN
jgi:spore coat polysaccharide biosynthesis protein SpsF